MGNTKPMGQFFEEVIDQIQTKYFTEVQEPYCLPSNLNQIQQECWINAITEVDPNAKIVGLQLFGCQICGEPTHFVKCKLCKYNQ